MTDTLPRAIADLCGVLMNDTRRTMINEERNEPKSIDLVQDEDGMWTVNRFGSPAGYITKIGSQRGGSQPAYRATTIHHEIKHCYSLESAKTWVFENYH
jgi:hypothetical protein